MEDSTKYNDIKRYVQDKKALYHKLLEYFDSSNNNNIEEKYQNLIQVIEDQKLEETKNDLHVFLNFIVKITNNINRGGNLLDKAKKILLNLKGTLKRLFSNSEIFNIFSQCKILLLFLLEEQIITMDQSIAGKINWKSYFAPEIKNFVNVKAEIELFNKDHALFEENRHKGENESEIARLIREDLIGEFITYVNKNDFSLNSKIENSIFETNEFLMTNEPTLIEYAAFFGSTQIFTYLYKNNVELRQSLWIYSIHSNHPEMIHILEENKVKPKSGFYIECYYESIKCHHNDMALYILDNFIKDESKTGTEAEAETENINIFLKYFNFSFIEFDCENHDLFFTLCKYGYATLIKFFMETKDVNINSEFKKYETDKKRKEKTALIFAVERENIEIVELLLTNEDIDVNKPKRCICVDEYEDFQNVTSTPPLIIAVMNNNLEIVKLLLSNPKIDVNANLEIELEEEDDKQIKTALICAIENNNKDIVEILLKHPKIYVDAIFERKIPYDSSYEEKSALCIAIEKKNTEIIKLLLSKNINLNSDQFIRIDYPYEEWTDPTRKTTKSALIIAIDTMNEDIINLLLNCPLINIKYELSCTFEYMSSMSSYSEYKLAGGWDYIMPLISQVLYCPSEDFHMKLDEEKPALCYSIEKNLNDIVKIFLSSDKFDVNASIVKNSSSFKADEEDRTNSDLYKWSPDAKSIIPALCIAIENNNEDIVKLLLSNPTIDINAKYFKDSYEFNCCYQKEHNDDDDYDDSEDENYWISKKEKKSPLEIAVKNKNVEIIKLLLQNQKIELNEIDYTDDDEIKKLLQRKK